MDKVKISLDKHIESKDRSSSFDLDKVDFNYKPENVDNFIETNLIDSVDDS